MTIVDSLCPKCLHQQQDANELKKLQELLKKALKSIAPRRVRPLTSILNTDSKFMGGQAGKDIPLIPRSIPRWLAQNNEPTSCPTPASHGRCLDVRFIGRWMVANSHLSLIPSFSSPYVVRVVTSHAPDVVALEPMKLGSLWRILKSMSKVAPAEQQLPKLHVAIAMARALADLHAAGLFHGSLSSHGVFRSTERVVKVGVPGTSDPNLSTLPWTAPERLGMFAPCTPEADIYALGVILTELDTLRAPFAEERWNDAQLMTAVGIHHCRPRLTGDCAPWYAALVNECLHPDPTKRPTAATIVATLNDKMAA
uniref:Protein kinase domain-containing protein n=1 Tax=Hucho hucho TaxID=62062 RepID=A0A4W5LTT7_9TELE